MDIVARLKTFLRVAETGSFSAAAIDLGLTQPAVSRQISALELHLNTRLFHRTTIAIALTVEGEKMIPMALQVLQAVDVLGEKGCIEGGAVSGKVRLSLPAPLGLYMSERFPVLLAGHPDLIIEMIFCEEPSDLVGNAIDLEVRLGPVADSSLICRRLGSTTACLVAAPSYLSRHAPPQSPEELTDHNCICYSRAGDGRTWSFSDGANEIPVRIAPHLIANNSVAVHRAALSGGGLAVLSHILVDADIQSGRLKRLMPAFPPTRLPISVVYPSRRNIPARVRTVLEFLVEAVDEDAQMASTAFA
jgi:DNA-binding transcriptional LysR family regulator